MESPSSSASKVHYDLKQGSISKGIVDVWIENHKGKVKPWEGPLPSPHRSPLRTFGGVLAKAMIVERPNEERWANSLIWSQMCGSLTMSSIRPRRRSMPEVNMASILLRSNRVTL